MSRFGLALALLIAVYAALLYAPLFFKASDYLRSHASNRDSFTVSENLKSAAARKTFGGIVQAGSGSLSHFSVSVLSRVSGGSF